MLSTAYKRPQTMKGGHEWWKYVYDEYYDCVLCPEYQALSYHYQPGWIPGVQERSRICVNCPTRHLCTHSKTVSKQYSGISGGYEDLADDVRYTPQYQKLYKRRKETIERVFADAKENTPCVIPSIEACPGAQLGEAEILLP